ncbi:EAL domain-containing protein [Sulfurospirillum sp. T05]|uniref:EAL domain-containing protein n=1 Tax=Sulfurospirillum tamanense TaxID=2813362 RepID=A0ABS2WSX3_9BACT|nr:EAL domain-containing protein [Sulfurospirillum tamanensis]
MRRIEILYIEWEDALAQNVIALLRPLSEHLYHATSVHEALRVFKSDLPPFVIMSASSSKGINIDLCKTFKTLSPKTKILLHVNPEESTVLLDAISFGVDTFALKPLNKPSFLATVQTMMHTFFATQKAEEALHLTRQLTRAFETSTIVSKTDLRGIITYANKAFEKISGYTQEELVGKPHNIVRHPDMDKSVFEDMWNVISHGQIWKGVVKNRHKDGGPYVVEATIIPILDTQGKVVEYMSIRHDISQLATRNSYLQDVIAQNEEIVKVKSNELLEKLYKDEITKLPNSLALQRDIPRFEGGTLFLLDINNFNIFNKLYGFAFGDILLQEVTKHIMFLCGNKEILYKLSADRYALLTHEHSQAHIDDTCNQIFAYFDTTEITVETIESFISFSIGVAKIEDGRDAIVDAEFALDISKKHGKRFKVVYDSGSSQIREELESIGWLNKTREFIHKDMIVPYFQPIVDVHTKAVHKYECLARVIDGDLVIPPLMFINAATKLGLLTSVTKSMINKSFQYFAGKDIRFSINITERDIMDGYLMEFIRFKAERYGIDPHNVTFEILENITLSKESDLITGTIGLVKDYGCDIAIDDFGSENSNFSRLLSLQSDYIKIDGSFVHNCDKDPEKQKIIDAIVQLAKRLGIKSIAEFVSTEAIFDTIKALGVDYAQGYLFGKPEPNTL